MKRNAFLCGLLAVLMLAGCGPRRDARGTVAPLEHEFSCWNRNSHWNENEAGEKLDAAPHEMDEDQVCSECGASFFDTGDGSVVLSEADQYGNDIRVVYYRPDGSVEEETYERVYDENGEEVSLKEYCNGVLAREVTENQIIFYSDDGARVEETYGEDGALLTRISYDADGGVVYTLRYEREYYDEGPVKCVLEYMDDELLSVLDYVLTDDGKDSWCCKQTAYLEDGTIFVATFDEYHQIISEEYFDADSDE